MKPEGVVFFGILVALFLGLIWWWRAYDLVTFDEKLQFNQPMIEKDGTRFGRRATRRRASDIERYSLVRYKTKRSSVILTGRVMAVEGERISIDGAEVYVDGQKVRDQYRRRTNENEIYPELIVPAGCVFVLTDVRNRKGADRYDSRNLGPVPVEAIMNSFSPKEPRSGKKALR
ncbi:MAG: signal peptidase I [Planctomycetes bacterium]|nr:signal peptidase I [Planctomycetota bacterium]